MNVHFAPIAMFDSGLGGLSVANEVRRLLPAEDILYVADNAYCPYGVKPPSAIRARSEAIAQQLVKSGAKALVIACNTATAVSLETIRSWAPIPVIGLEPAVKPGVGRTATGKIGVLATASTVRSDRLRHLIDRYGEGVEVIPVAAPEFVELVEAGLLTGPAVEGAVRRVISPLLAAGVDTIVLGCTHYPFLRTAISAVAGEAVTVIDSGEAVARRVASLLTEQSMFAPSDRSGSLTIATSGDAGAIGPIARRLASTPVELQTLQIVA